MNKLKKTIYKNSAVHNVVSPVYHSLKRTANFSSGDYWEKRYKKGGNSGAGSYGRLAEYKAEILNKFAKDNAIKSVIEFGSGDGAQLELFNFKHYLGLDVSKSSIDRCIKKYGKDKNKSFYLYDSAHFQDNFRAFAADLSMSLDVVYHLVEDKVFEKYMHDLFGAGKKNVIIYASNMDENKRVQAQHVRHRKFTDWVKQYEKEWKLDKVIKNKYPLRGLDEIDQSPADFYIYSKV